MSELTTVKASELTAEIRDLLGKKQTRTAVFDRAAVDVDARTVRLAFSSSAPYERSFGIEILDHSPGSVRMDRMADGAAVLMGHDWDRQIGVVEDASIDPDEFGRAAVRLSRNQLGADALRDIEDGILTKVSVGYIVHKMVLEEQGDDGPDIYRCVDWEPLEVSFVAIPADISVGVAREIETEEKAPAATPAVEETTMSEENKVAVAPEVDVRSIRDEARKDETDRVQNILAVGSKFNMQEKAAKAVQDGTPLSEFQRDVFNSFEIPQASKAAEIGLTDKEVKRFSVSRAIAARAHPGDAKIQAAAAFELEASRAAEAKLIGDRKGNLAVPYEVMTRATTTGGTVGTAADGGYLKGTDHLGASFIDVLRNRSLVTQMGATEMLGLVGDAAIPSLDTGGTPYWLDAESTAVTASKQVFGQVSLTPHTAGIMSDVSRRLLIQSNPSVDAIIMRDLAAGIATAVDAAALHGDGTVDTGQPDGLTSTALSGFGSVVGGANGATPAWAHIVELETDVAVANADIGRVGYLTNAKVRGILKQVFKNATYGTDPIWADGNEPGYGMVNGYRAGVSNNVSSTLLKSGSSNTGAHSAIFFGNWEDLVIAYFGGFDLLVDPYTSSSNGWVRMVAFQSVDIGFRRKASFSIMADANA